MASSPLQALSDSALRSRIQQIGRGEDSPALAKRGSPKHLAKLDYSILQQCIHCGLCLPTCPTYDATKLERNSPRGRIALMRGIAEGKASITEPFGRELYFCLGCLACETACPAGVEYVPMFEAARADIEHSGVLAGGQRDVVRAIMLRYVFTSPRVLRLIGRALYWYQRTGLQWLARRVGVLRLLPRRWRELEPLTPRINQQFSDELIAQNEPSVAATKYRVGMLTGCVQDLAFSHVNRDTVEVLNHNGCEVITPRLQHCCGSLHAHNGEPEVAAEMARRNIESMEQVAGPLDQLDAIISNAAGCGSHLKHYDRLLAEDARYVERAKVWSAKVRDVHEWLAQIGIAPPSPSEGKMQKVSYHEACHLCHGQKITRQPRELLKTLPNVELAELKESSWCCGSAGIYNITQPEMSRLLLDRKLANIQKSGAAAVASANTGCNVQLAAGLREAGMKVEVVHPVTLLARAYRAARASTSATS